MPQIQTSKEDKKSVIMKNPGFEDQEDSKKSFFSKFWPRKNQVQRT